MHTRDIEETARAIGARLAKFRTKHPLVLALPPGGIALAQWIAQGLGGDFEMVQAEGIVSGGYRGAIAETGEIVLDSGSTNDGAEPEFAGRIVEQMAHMLVRRGECLPQSAPPAVSGRLVIVVADGLASGVRMRAALTSLRNRGADFLVAVAVAGTDRAVELVRPLADEVLCLMTSAGISGVGRQLRGWKHVPESAVLRLLRGFAGPRGPVGLPALA